MHRVWVAKARYDPALMDQSLKKIPPENTLFYKVGPDHPTLLDQRPSEGSTSLTDRYRIVQELSLSWSRSVLRVWRDARFGFLFLGHRARSN